MRVVYLASSIVPVVQNKLNALKGGNLADEFFQATKERKAAGADDIRMDRTSLASLWTLILEWLPMLPNGFLPKWPRRCSWHACRYPLAGQQNQ
jgi:hypothetical protein